MSAAAPARDAAPRVPTDAELVRRSRTDPEAFAVLFDRYAAMLYRYVSRRLGPGPAEDVVGETFLVAFGRRARYDLARDDARPWLFGIATRLVARHHRDEAARYRALHRLPAAAEAVPEDAVDDALTAHAARPALAAALEDLPRRDRDVLLLIAWADLSYAEAAQALGIAVGTVRSRLNRARRKVRAALGGTDPTKEV
ncbi:RNA polymerase sigma factor [Actinomadura flavalba]|uniref:RNA polymerase sigma factor n=1 Tax=Actinomadura flavalba TaxID=1120938 RepID=UPI000685E701|nr:sigma-70 family RNA polymerase sigma factor [Actinomadura flavalba]